MKRLISGAALLVALLLTGTAAADSKASPHWQLVQSIGDVQVTTGGFQPTAIDPSAPIPEGAVVVTGRNGRAVLKRGAEQIVVHASTKLVLTDSSDSMTRLLQTTGSAWFKIGKKHTPHFQVDTPYLAAVVKGTSFLVTVTPEKADVQVREGAVEVSTNSGGAVTLVKPGMTAEVKETNQGEIAVRDRTGKSQIVNTNQGGWAPKDSGPGGPDGGGTLSTGGATSAAIMGSGGAVMLRTSLDAGPSLRNTPLSGIERNGISVQFSSGSVESTGIAAPRGNDKSDKVVEADFTKTPKLRPSSEDNALLSAQAKSQRDPAKAKFVSGTHKAAAAAAKKVTSAVRTMTHHKPVKINASFPWKEFTLCLIGLVGLMVFSHVRGLKMRTKQANSRSR